jgi:hypothetical protein
MRLASYLCRIDLMAGSGKVAMVLSNILHSAMKRFVINLGLFVFLVFSSMLVALYFSALYDKIVTPQFRNLDAARFIWIGFIVVAFIVIDLLILRRFVRGIREEIKAVKKETGRA